MTKKRQFMMHTWLPLALLFSLVMIGCSGIGSEQVKNALEGVLAEADDEAILQFYAERDFGLLWVNEEGLKQNAKDFLSRLSAAERDGLEAGNYDPQRIEEKIRAAFVDIPENESERIREVAELEYRFSVVFADYAHDLANGQIRPSEANSEWHLKAEELDRYTALNDLEEKGVDDALDELAEQREEYAQIRWGLNYYQYVRAKGGWPQVPDGESLAEGASGERVALLQQRLMASGDLDSTAIDSVFDSSVEQAVRRFQTRHGIDETGTVGPLTITALNVPLDDRIQKLKLNLERSRWLPTRYGDSYILINIPDFHLFVYEDGEVRLDMPVIVGEEMYPTPMFSDTMTYVAFSPYWNVPHSIAERDILPHAREDWEYLVENGYEVVSSWGPDAEVYDPEEVDLDRVEREELVIRQKPGPQNALGAVKFMFPNEYSIYLHDTPAGHLFSQADRGFSNGCIRVRDPIDLAGYVLRHNEGWDQERIEESMDLEEEKPVVLGTPIPVFIVYLTAWVDEDNMIHFRESIYDHDTELLAALAARSRNSDYSFAFLQELLEEL